METAGGVCEREVEGGLGGKVKTDTEIKKRNGPLPVVVVRQSLMS